MSVSRLMLYGLLRGLLHGSLFGLVAQACEASPAPFCGQSPPLSAAQHDRLMRFGEVVKTELERSGASLALIARTGVDLARFGVRYSHAGISLKESQNTRWSVRQLYYGCDERRPGLYDQGLAGFLMGSEAPPVGFVSVLLLPAAEAAQVERAALENPQALRLLGTTYSANAYPFDVRYQNCNQWLVELLAVAWGGLDGPEAPRAQAQAWLQRQAYEPTVFDVGSPALMWLGSFIAGLHSDDHPQEDLAQYRYRVSMPASIEAFVRRTVPGAVRVEFCHKGDRVVIRRGWESIADSCEPGESDTVVGLN